MMQTSDFIELLSEKGHDLYREMPWRQDTRPYYILVSELMLQQTQVDRVIPKFNDFIAAFPTESILAATSLADVVTLWQGLGYNRRAKFLHESAKMLDNLGSFPNDTASLMALPGVGKNTAGAIQAYAFNIPAVFIETNVRSVYLHHFFADGGQVDDSEIITLVEKTIDHDHPREFYWALMDYGSYLKRQGVGAIKQSKQYKKQSLLKGSVREVRGQIIKQLAKGNYNEADLRKRLRADDRFTVAIDGLIRDGLITKTQDEYHLTK